jgi:pimeloyl-ACP methyl ester carboxylesterase
MPPSRSSPLFERAEKLKLLVDGNKVIGFRWNHPQPKRFLILHGLHSNAKNFERYVLPMVKKGYEVMAFDAPAHGDSEGKQTTVLQYRETIREICRLYGPVHAFLSHSFGALALSLALEELPHSEETRAALIAPATETSTAVDYYFRFLDLDQQIRPEFENLVLNTGGNPLSWYSIARAVKNLKASILWIHDEDDDVTPLSDVVPIINHQYPNIRFMITKGLGHRRIYRDRLVQNAISDFF